MENCSVYLLSSESKWEDSCMITDVNLYVEDIKLLLLQNNDNVHFLINSRSTKRKLVKHKCKSFNTNTKLEKRPKTLTGEKDL